MSILPRAVREKWTRARFADEAGIGQRMASDLLDHAVSTISGSLVVALEHSQNRLSDVARKAREAELTACEGVLAHILKLDSQIAAAQDIDAFELEKLVNIRAKYAKHIESVTGMDVIKAIAIRTAVDKSGNALSWDGINMLESMPVPVPALPAPASPSLGDLW